MNGTTETQQARDALVSSKRLGAKIPLSLGVRILTDLNLNGHVPSETGRLAGKQKDMLLSMRDDKICDNQIDNCSSSQVQHNEEFSFWFLATRANGVYTSPRCAASSPSACQRLLCETMRPRCDGRAEE